MNIKAILLMAGGGDRFDSSLPKQFHLLREKKLYRWALDTLLSSGYFSEIILVCHKDFLALVIDEIKDLSSCLTVVEGGNTRQASSYQGLLACETSTDIVLIHDAARPFVTKEILQFNLEGAKLYGAVDTCIPSSDTVVYAPRLPLIESIPPRAHFFLGQTPQTFRYNLILEAHQKALKNPPFISPTDDGSLVLALPHPLYQVKGAVSNFKITTAFDLEMAQSYLCSSTFENSPLSK